MISQLPRKLYSSCYFKCMISQLPMKLYSSCYFSKSPFSLFIRRSLASRIHY